MEYNIGMLDCVKSRNSESFVVKTSNNNYIIDTGYNNAFESLKELYKDTCNGANRLDYLIISHGDDDHCGSIKNITNHFSPNFIIFSPIHIYKHLLLQEITDISFKEGDNTSDLLAKIQNSSKYKKFYRIMSRKKSKYDISEDYDLISQNILKNDGFDLDIIELEDGVNPYFDIVLAVSDTYLKDRSSEHIKNDIKTRIQRDLFEFQTFDTGQTDKVEQILRSLIKDINNGSIFIDTDNKDELSKFLKRIMESGFIEYNRIPPTINKENLIKIFKANVLKKINNAMSLIVRINDTLFTGDSEREQIRMVVNILDEDNINIVKVPHHGSNKNHLSELYTKLQPEICMLKSSSKTVSTEVVRYLLDNTNTNICNSSYYKQCKIGIILKIINNNGVNSKYQVIPFIDYHSVEVAATLSNLNRIKTLVI